MANNIELAKVYSNIVQTVYKKQSLTAMLDSDPSVGELAKGGHEIVIPKFSGIDGLADYNRNLGYTKGDIELSYQTVALDYDRNRRFLVDAMDDEETMSVAFGRLVDEFMKRNVVPELDAMRFSKLAEKAANHETVDKNNENFDILSLITSAQTTLDDLEVSDGRYLFITSEMYNKIKSLNTTVSREILADFDGRIVKVPSARFFTNINLIDGNTTETKAGGFSKSNDSEDILFMIVEPTASIQIIKHEITGVYPPDKDADGYTATYRVYGVENVYDEKASGIYYCSQVREVELRLLENTEDSGTNGCYYTCTVGEQNIPNVESEFTAPAGKEFSKWNTKADGTGTNYDSQASIDLQDNLTLYAIWVDTNDEGII